jgi:hypothetical protein
MIALPQKSLNYSKGLFEVSLGASRMFAQSEDNVTFKERFLYKTAMAGIRLSWFIVDLQTQSKIDEMVNVNVKLRSLNLAKLTSTNYRGLRIFRDESFKQLNELNSFLSNPSSLLSNYQVRTLKRYSSPLEQSVAILDELFAKVNLVDKTIEGFRVISEAEAWSSRTTAYNYATT